MARRLATTHRAIDTTLRALRTRTKGRLLTFVGGLTLKSGAPVRALEKGKTVKSRVRIFGGFALAAIGVIALTAGMSYAGGKDHTVLRGDVMVGVSPPYTGALGTPIRGINGGGAPWVIGDAEFRLRESGRVDVEFEGLVIGPGGPAAIVGTNPAPNMKVTVSCLSIDSSTTPPTATTVNVSSETFPVDTAGNGEARVHVDLPSPCIAPIFFVASAGGSWFASSGV